MSLNSAFRELRKNGYFAKQNFYCCQTCGWSAIPDEQSSKAVFYHAQDAADRKRAKPYFMAWSGDAQYIRKVLLKHGVMTHHDGSDNSRIQVLHEMPDYVGYHPELGMDWIMTLTDLSHVSLVSSFFSALRNEGICVHPDDDFRDYVNQDGTPSFTPKVADHLNSLMNSAIFWMDKYGYDLYILALYINLSADSENN